MRNGLHTEKEYFKEQNLIEAARSQTLEVNKQAAVTGDYTSEKVKAELADLSQRYHLS